MRIERWTNSAIALLILLAIGSDKVSAQEQERAPLTLRSQGSFFVGGTSKVSDALSSQGSSQGTITTGQMYVQY